MNGNSDWNDEDIVPVAELRPSREHFGPLPSSFDHKSRGRRNGQPSRASSVRTERSNHNRPPRAEQRGARSQEARQAHSRDSQPSLRGALGRAAGGMLSGDRPQQDARELIGRPVTDGTVAVFSRKAGVGKTSISAYLGLILATERKGRVAALDGDTETGLLGWMLAPEAPSYLATTPEGLDVIVGDAQGGPLSPEGLDEMVRQLAHNYEVSIFDTGAEASRSVGRVLVSNARVVLLVMDPSLDSVRAAERTLAWMKERPGDVMRPDAHVIAVINGISSKVKASHVDKVEDYFASRCSGVVRIPWDAHMANGDGAVSLDRLAKPTRRAFMDLAATTIEVLTRSARRSQNVSRRSAVERDRRAS